MTRLGYLLLAIPVVAFGLIWSGEIAPAPSESFVTKAEAIIGRPLTPVSYAGVARRTTRRAVLY